MPPSCKQPGCPLLQDGKCLEGFDPPSKCPNYLEQGDTAATASAPTAAAVSVRPADGIDLPAGTAFDPLSVYVVARESVARVVILAGEQKCGKTTLLGSLYELFQEGPVGSLACAACYTLPAFEQRCHAARMASGLDTPDTERTKPGEGLRFVHLALFDRDTAARRNLLIGDMSGELFDSLHDSQDECRKYQFLRRADHFVAMLNGEKLAEGHHADTYARARGLVRSLLDADVLRNNTHVTLLTTKWDLIVGREAKVHQRIADLEKHFRDAFAARLPQIHFAHVAARPEETNLDFAFGLDQLIAQWMALSGLQAPPSLDVVPAVREFDRFVATQTQLMPSGI